jgi:hypothetical protein
MIFVDFLKESWLDVQSCESLEDELNEKVHLLMFVMEEEEEEELLLVDKNRDMK